MGRRRRKKTAGSQGQRDPVSGPGTPSGANLQGDAGLEAQGVPLFNIRKLEPTWEQQRSHCTCIQNPPGISLYKIVGRKSRGGVDLPIYRCARGTVSLESFHLHLNRFIPGHTADRPRQLGDLFSCLAAILHGEARQGEDSSHGRSHSSGRRSADCNTCGRRGSRSRSTSRGRRDHHRGDCSYRPRSPDHRRRGADHREGDVRHRSGYPSRRDTSGERHDERRDNTHRDLSERCDANLPVRPCNRDSYRSRQRSLSPGRAPGQMSTLTFFNSALQLVQGAAPAPATRSGRGTSHSLTTSMT
ncbi:hypothetical protein ElyMa_000768800 [Elysia marginata]|uniref:Uncharacterized protein n=1 Tax=Elysia marginata TaxID=1093978 RepID=A0AAV4GSQ7_9GAST|nr:hypothetical protein ElyMa_000768800 [Elysia marginata]